MTSTTSLAGGKASPLPSAGLSHRPRLDLLADTLDWERARGLLRDRRAGLTDQREQELIARLAGHQ